MNKFASLFLIILFSCSFSHAQNKADDIIGYYFLVDPFSGEESQTYIYKSTSGKYEGKVVWVSNIKKKPFLNYIFLKNLVFNPEDNEWQNGTIQYPGKKGVFKTFIRFENKNTIKVRGYWGVSLLGKNVFWTKESNRRIQQ